MKKCTVLFLLLLLFGCASSQHTIKPLIKKITVVIPNKIPYSENATVKRAVMDQCDLGVKLSEAIEKASESTEVNIIRNDEAFKFSPGTILEIVISGVNAVNAGLNSGGYRDVAVSGKLIKDNIEIGNFKGFRPSNYRPFSGQCKLLERCTDTLGREIVEWLKNPSTNSRIGE